MGKTMTAPKRYRKKPVVVEAIQYVVSNSSEVVAFTQGDAHFPIDSDHEWICKGCGEVASQHGNCKTLEGFHIICPGDFIIKGIKGEFYPCKPDIFEETYEEVEDHESQT